jgi:hypothetical protein
MSIIQFIAAGAGAGGGAGSGPTALSFFGSGTGNPTALAPAGVNVGDLIVLLSKATDPSTSAAPADTTPSGFTKINTQAINSAGGSMRHSIFLKVADGTEGGTSLFGLSASTDPQVIAVFRGDKAITGVTVHDSTGEITDGNPSSQTCNASGGPAPLVVLAAYGINGNVASTGIGTRSFSPAADGELSFSETGFLKYKIYNSSPQDTAIDMNDEGQSNSLMSFYLSVS